jgi:hypothetical protein
MSLHPHRRTLSLQQAESQQSLVDSLVERLQQAWKIEVSDLRPRLSATRDKAEKAAILNAAARSDVGREFKPEELNEYGKHLFEMTLRRIRLAALQQLFREEKLV